MWSWRVGIDVSGHVDNRIQETKEEQNKPQKHAERGRMHWLRPTETCHAKLPRAFLSLVMRGGVRYDACNFPLVRGTFVGRASCARRN